jgi:hypothetical protein
MGFDRAIGPFADYLNESEHLKFLEGDTFANGDGCTRLSIRDFILKYESPSPISIRYIFKADFYGFCNKNIGSMTEICLLNHARYKILSNIDPFDNFTISDGSDAGVLFDGSRTSINNLFYSEAILSNTQVAFYYDDKNCSQISIPKTSLTSKKKKKKESVKLRVLSGLV